MLVKKGQNNKIINLHEKRVIYTSRFVYIHQDSYIYIKIRIYTARFVYIHQDSYIYSKIRIYTSRFLHIHQDSCSSDIKESMTAGWIIVFSNGHRKWQQNEEAISSLLRRVYGDDPS